jgi:predicted ATPase/DNA-binding XRE family transcriptional regulator
MQEEVIFGTWLRKRRRALDLTRQAFADQVGCAEVTLRRIEAGTLKPSKELANILLEKLSIPELERPQWVSFARGLTGFPSQISLSSNKPISNLPAPLTTFIGRTKEQADVTSLITKYRLVTLTGPAGIGKTRLSIEAARAVLSEFQDGIFFVTLALLNDPNLMALYVVQALGFVEVGNLPTEKQLLEGIGNKRMLIVLDNCEHLIEGVAALVFNILSACPHIKIITTSRESLRISGEWLYTVPAFDVPKTDSAMDMETALRFPALTLFAERARAVRSDFVLTTENIGIISTICKHLDGLPLAIELIASRIRLMPPQALLERLSGQFILTVDGMRPTSERQKTLNNAIRWSYSLLSTEEQKLFAYLSVFSGGFTLDAVEAMFSQIFTDKSISSLVVSLLDKSFLQRAIENDRSLEARYTMLVTIQEFARKRLLEIGEETKTRNYHLTYFCEFAEQARPQLRGPQQLTWLDRLEDDYGNILAALKWAHESGAISEGLCLATDLERFWLWRTHLQEPILALEKLLAQPLPDGQIQASATGHRVAGRLQFIVGNQISAAAHAGESARLCLLLGPEGKLGLAMDSFRLDLYTRRVAAKEPVQVYQRYEEVLRLLQETGDQAETAQWICDMGYDLTRVGDLMGARQALEQSLMLFREYGDGIGASHPKRMLAQIAWEEENYTEARTQFEETLYFYQQARLNFLIDIPLWMLGVIAAREGDHGRAKEWYTECLLLDQQIGLTRQLAECFIGFAGIASAEKHFESSAQLIGAAETVIEERPDPGLESFDQIELKRLTTILREELGDARFKALVSQGRLMTKEQAITLALQSA